MKIYEYVTFLGASRLDVMPWIGLNCRFCLVLFPTYFDFCSFEVLYSVHFAINTVNIHMLGEEWVLLLILHYIVFNYEMNVAH
jgi:hypothetical protein